jgi:REP element-mobilizing transposase RayT
MGRAPREHRQVGWFHVMNRGAGRRAIFLDDRDRVEFGRALGEACERSRVQVHAYCLMPNHFHLLVNCPDGGLSEMMQWLQSVVTRRFNARTDSDGPILRGRFRSKEVDSDAYLLTATRYIHTNPIPLLDGRPLESYRWSSLRTYLGHRRPAPWMRTDVVAGMLGDDPQTLAALTSGPTGLVAPTVLESVAAFALDEAGDAITGASRLERTVLLVLAGELGDAAGPLVEHLGFDDTRRLRQAVWRANRRADAEPVLRQVAQRLLAAA